jgi:hypothetical protein
MSGSSVAKELKKTTGNSPQEEPINLAGDVELKMPRIRPVRSTMWKIQ